VPNARGPRTRIVPRAADVTDPTAATRTERHVGPPVTRLRPVTKTADGARLIEVVGMMIVLQWLPLTVLLIGLVIKIIALGTIPRNRRPSSSLAWLLLITLPPVFGLLLFFLIGSPFVRGRRERVQTQANQVILEHTADLPPASSELPIGMGSLVRLNRRLSSLPPMTGTSHGLSVTMTR
jgi:hypothetical protein